MLKRALTIVILTALALVLMGAGTEAKARPVENFVTLETETGIHVIFWGTAPAPNGMERPIRTFAPVQNIPQALLDRVPEHVRTALTTGVTQSSDDWDCHAEAGYPYKSGSKVKARGSVSCVGAPVEENTARHRAEQRHSDDGYPL